jgi:predicted component of type VI protein secretion system
MGNTEGTEGTPIRSPLNGGVRLVVQRGASRRTSLELSPAEPLTRIVIGSSSQCDWRIFARGVRARHLRLIWSHGRLRIDDICEPGAVKLDGRPVCHRIELCAAARVAFGEAVLVVEHSNGAADLSETAIVPAQTAPDDEAGSAPAPASAEAATVLDGMLDAPAAQQAAREPHARGPQRSPLRRKVALFSLAIVVLLASAAARAALRAPQKRIEDGSAAATARPTSPRETHPSVTPARTAPASASAEPFVGTVTPNEAVARLVAGRRSEAIAAYRALASKQPANRAYAAVVQMLDRRSANRCKPSSNGEAACAP